MDSEWDSPGHGIGDKRTTFRKPSNDAANRKYRRRSHANDGSSSSDGSPERNRTRSPNQSSGDIRKVSELNNSRRDDRRESDRDSGRIRYGGRDDDSHRHDRYSRDTHREDYGRQERDAVENSRKYRSSPSRSSRDFRGDHHSDRRRVETEHSRSRSDSDRRTRDKYTGSGHRSKGHEKGEEQSSNRTGSGRKHTDSRSTEKEMDYAGSRDHPEEKRDFFHSSGDRHFHDDKREYEDSGINREDNRFKCPRDRSEDKISFTSEKLDPGSKKLKGFSSEKFADGKPEASKPVIGLCEKELTGQSSSKEPGVSGDLDAAKVAAMKAAELVNRNLAGTGYLTTDQKKKLLWGNKKSVAVEETAHRWDTALVGDRERQEKFNKLMSLRLPWYVWPIVGCEGKHKTRGESERARSPRREAEGTAAGSREAVHSWTSPKRWTHSWVRSLILKPLSSCLLPNGFCSISLYSVATKSLIFITLHSMLVPSNRGLITPCAFSVQCIVVDIHASFHMVES